MPIIKNFDSAQAYLCDVASIVKRRTASSCYDENSELSSMGVEKDDATSIASTYVNTVPDISLHRMHPTLQTETSLVLSASQTLSLQSAFNDMQKRMAAWKEERQSIIREREALQQEVIQLKCELAASKSLNDHYLLKIRKYESLKCDDAIAFDVVESQESEQRRSSSIIKMNSIKLLAELDEAEVENAKEEVEPTRGHFSLLQLQSPQRKSTSSEKSAASLPIMKTMNFFRRNSPEDTPREILINGHMSQDNTQGQARWRRASMDQSGEVDATTGQTSTRLFGRRATFDATFDHGCQDATAGGTTKDMASGQKLREKRATTVGITAEGKVPSQQPTMLRRLAADGIGKFLHQNLKKDFTRP